MFRRILQLSDTLSQQEKIYLLVVSILYIGYSLFHINTYPVYIDEALTYNEYTSKGLTTILSDYSMPNNHVFFSVLSYLFHLLPFDLLFNLRLPNLLLGLCASWIVYLYIRSLYGHKTAIVPHLFFTFSYFVTFYSTFARGYMLIILITLICFICIQKIREESKPYLWVIFTIASIIGFYTIPVFLYSSASLGCYMLILFYKEQKIWLTIVKSYLCIAAGSLLLYLPIIVSQGLSVITNNRWTKPLEFNEVLAAFKDRSVLGIYDKLLGINSFYVICLFIAVLAFVFFRIKTERERKMILGIFSFFILPFVFMIVHKVIPGARTWCYLVIPLTLGIAVIIQSFSVFKKIPLFLVIGAGFMVVFAESLVFQKSHPHGALEADYEANKLSEHLLTYRFENYYFETFPLCFEEMSLRFAYARKNTAIHFYTDYTPQNDVPWKKLDCVFLKRESRKLKLLNMTDYRLFAENGDFLIYVKPPMIR